MAEFDRYFAEGGDEKFRYTYNIKTTDVVVDVGAYHGTWSKKIYDKYKCRILAFEPVFHEAARNTLKGTNVVLNTVGLGNKNEDLDISILADSTSVFKGSNDKKRIKIRDFIEVMNEYGVERIKLLKINIEGGEYGLLEYLINSDYISKIDIIQVQFHDFMPDAVNRRNMIQAKLVSTHHLTYNFEFVWENWEINR
jgi:FkbM family methyltransferase